MIEETIGEIEAKIRGAEAVSEERKRELLQLIATLKTEVGSLEKTHGEQAQTIAEFAKISAQEATSREPKPASQELSLRDLRSSVEGFEKSHPKLVEIVNRISNLLSSFGI